MKHRSLYQSVLGVVSYDVTLRVHTTKENTKAIQCSARVALHGEGEDLHVFKTHPGASETENIPLSSNF